MPRHKRGMSRGSHCIRKKRTRHGMKCADFSKRGRKPGRRKGS